MSPARIRELTGVQQLRINTLYQLDADWLNGTKQQPWLNLPEYILIRCGGERVAEITKGTHSQMIDLRTNGWCREQLAAAGTELTSTAKLVAPGTLVGKLVGPLACRLADVPDNGHFYR